MNRFWMDFRPSIIALAGILMPSSSQGQFTEVKDMELLVPLVHGHAYVPNRKAFEACWKKIPKDQTFDASSNLELGDTAFFRYESVKHHFRSIVQKVSRKTLLSLTHFDEPGHDADYLVGISQTVDLTPEHLRKDLEYLPLGAQTGLLTEDYPLTATGEENHEVILRDVVPAVLRIIVPFSYPEIHASHPPTDADWKLASRGYPFRDYDHPSKTTQFSAVARAYAHTVENFETLWKSCATVCGPKDVKKFIAFCKEANSYEPKVFLAYQAGKDHPRVLVDSYHTQNYYVMVRYNDPAKDDLMMLLGFPFEGIPVEKIDLLAHRLMQCLDTLPYCLDVAPPQKGYLFKPDGAVDSVVWARDFPAQPQMAYPQRLDAEPRVLTVSEKAHRYLSPEETEKLARQWCEIHVTDCQVSDLSYAGLVKVANRTLKAAHRPEKVHLDFPDPGKEADPDHFEKMRQMDHPFGPVTPKGRLDRQKLTEEINRGSLFDLLNNLNGWTGHQTGWYSDGIFIPGGENWPKLPDKKDYYPLIFK